MDIAGITMLEDRADLPLAHISSGQMVWLCSSVCSNCMMQVLCIMLSEELQKRWMLQGHQHVGKEADASSDVYLKRSAAQCR